MTIVNGWELKEIPYIAGALARDEVKLLRACRKTVSNSDVQLILFPSGSLEIIERVSGVVATRILIPKEVLAELASYNQETPV